MVEQELAPPEVLVEIVEPREIFLQRVRFHLGRHCLAQERREQGLVQLGADEAQPLLQPAALHAFARADAGSGELFGDMLQDRDVFGQDHAVIGAHHRHEAERVDGVEVGIVPQHLLGLGIDLDEVGRMAGLIQRDPCCHRAGERREIKVHG